MNKDTIRLTPEQDETIRWFKRYGGCHIKALRIGKINPLINKGLLEQYHNGLVQLTKLGATAKYEIQVKKPIKP